MFSCGKFQLDMSLRSWMFFHSEADSREVCVYRRINHLAVACFFKNKDDFRCEAKYRAIFVHQRRQVIINSSHDCTM